MTNNRSGESTFHGHGVTTTGFLGGITFAAMVLLIEFESSLNYSEILITGTALVSVLFIISTLGMMRVASGDISSESTFSNYMSGFATVGFFGLMAILPFLVWQFAGYGAIIILIVEAFVIGIFFKYVKE